MVLGGHVSSSAAHAADKPAPIGDWLRSGVRYEFQIEANGAEEREPLMLDEPVSEFPSTNDARWSSEVTDNSGAAAIVWLFLLAILFVTGLPISLALLGRFADLGAGFARLITILLAAFLVWLTSSYGILHFRAVWCAVALLLVYGLGLIALRWTHGSRQAPSLGISDIRAIAWSELSFWVVFALFLLYRLINPDSWHPIWGGEKPMEFAHINAILRSGEFPPFDPWYSGGLLNYYYYGEYLVAFLFKLTGIPSEIAFNLAQPTVMGMLASGAYSVSATLGARLSGVRFRPPLVGFLGVLLMVAIGNLTGFERFVDAFPSWPQADFLGVTWAGSRAIDGGITEFPYFTGLYADLHAHVVSLPVTVLVIALCFGLVIDWPSGSHHRPSLDRDGGTYSRTLLQLLFIGLALGTLSAANAWDVPVYALLVGASLWTAAGRSDRTMLNRIATTVIGLGVTGGIAYLGFKPFHDSFEALYSSIDWVPVGTAFRDFAIHLGGFSLILALGLPLLLTSHPDGSRGRAEKIVILVGVTTLMVLATLTVPWQDHASENFNWTDAGMAGILTALLGIALSVLARDTVLSWLVVIWIATAIATAGLGWLTFGIALFLAAAGAVTWIFGTDSAARYTGLLAFAGFGVAAGVERVFLVDDLASLPDWFRMNTVFKLYNQVWVLLALASAAAIAGMVVQARASQERDATTPEERGAEFDDSSEPLLESPTESRRLADKLSRPLAWVGIGASTAVIVASLCYPLLATKPRLDLRFPSHPTFSTLNALDWMNYGTLQLSDGSIVQFAEDKDVIDWFNDSVGGTPVIAEASIGPYRGNGSRISIATGLPSVLGWDRHERQQRYEPGISQRYFDLRTLYDTPDLALKEAVIDRYQIDFIVVGDLERKALVDAGQGTKYASEEGLNAFESMLGERLEIAFESGYTRVYRVL